MARQICLVAHLDRVARTDLGSEGRGVGSEWLPHLEEGVDSLLPVRKS